MRSQILVKFPAFHENANFHWLGKHMDEVLQILIENAPQNKGNEYILNSKT